MHTKDIKRGDIFYCDFGNVRGTIQSGRRMVLVLQANSLSRISNSVVVATVINGNTQCLPSHIELGEIGEIPFPAVVLLDQISTVSEVNLQDRICHIEDEVSWKRINGTLKNVLGLRPVHAYAKDDIRCLCGRCLSSYLDTGKYIAFRADPFDLEKRDCDICGGRGFDYVVREKAAAKGAAE